jgi:hypothetical protein
MSDPRDDDELISSDNDREDFAPLNASDLRGDEAFEDSPPLADEPSGPGIDYDDLAAQTEINDEETT